MGRKKVKDVIFYYVQGVSCEICHTIIVNREQKIEKAGSDELYDWYNS